MPPGGSDAAATSSSSSDSTSYGQHLRITVSANQGGRRYMEDRVHIECVRLPCGTIDYVYLAVYDGHGGSEASDYVRKHLLKNIQSQSGFNGTDEEMLAAIKKGFVETHLAMWKVVDDWPLTPSGYTSTAGTTASCAFIRRGKIFIGHVGDSAVILGEKNGCKLRAVSLTVDHKPDSFLEEQRINNAGGMVMKKSGITRVVWTRPIRGHVGPVRRSTPTESIAFLAVARALGDLWSYNRETKQFIVSPEPDVAAFDLSNNELCLVLGSDGLTNVLKPDQIVDIVNHYERMPRDEHGQLPNHSRWLLRHALEGWGTLRADNISAITVMFDKQGAGVRDATVLADSIDLDLEKALTDFENSTMIIGPNYCRHLATLQVPLFYLGIVDSNFTTEIDYSGPGFTRDVRRAVTFVQMPNVPALPVDRSPTLHRLSELLNASSEVVGLSSNGSTGIILEEMEGLILQNVTNGNVLYPRDEDVAREEIVGDESGSDNGDGGDGSRNDVDVSAHAKMCSTNSGLETATDVMQRKGKAMNTSDIAGRKRRRNSGLDESIDNVEHSKSWSSSADQSRSSPQVQAMRPQRLVLSARRRMRTRSSGPMEDDDSDGDGNEAAEVSSEGCRSATTCFSKSYQGIIPVPRPNGGASALSPTLMLAALRTRDQLFEHDPFTRDLILAGRRLGTCLLPSSLPRPPQKKLRISTENWIGTDHVYGNRTENSEKSEPDKGNVAKAERVTTSAIATTRSRIWDFLSSFLGNRGSTK